MPTIYRRRGSDQLRAQYLEAIPQIERWKEGLRHTAKHQVSQDADVEFISEPNSRVIDGFLFRAAVQRAVVHEGWRHVKTRRSIEPRVGAPGRTARHILATIGIPEDQPGHILTDAGLPETYTAHGEKLPVEWMFCDGSLWFSIPSAGTVTGLGSEWETVDIAEYSAMQEIWARDEADVIRHSDINITA